MTQESQTHGHAQEPPAPFVSRLGKKRGRRLFSITNVRAALADVIRQHEDGTLDNDAARTRGYLLRSLAEIIQKSDLEQRIAALEEKGR